MVKIWLFAVVAGILPCCVALSLLSGCASVRDAQCAENPVTGNSIHIVESDGTFTQLDALAASRIEQLLQDEKWFLSDKSGVYCKANYSCTLQISDRKGVSGFLLIADEVYWLGDWGIRVYESADLNSALWKALGEFVPSEDFSEEAFTG